MNLFLCIIGCFPSFSGAGGGVRFSLRGITYQNNSLVTLEDIGEGGNALLCLTDQPACCRPPYTGGNISVQGNWYFPNGTRVPSSGMRWDIHRTRGPSVVIMHRRKEGVDGLYHCDIPDAANVIQKLYIGVYNVSTGECYIRKCTLPFPILCICNNKCVSSTQQFIKVIIIYNLVYIQNIPNLVANICTYLLSRQNKPKGKF